MAKKQAAPVTDGVTKQLELLEKFLPIQGTKASAKGDRSAEVAKAVLAVELLMGQESATIAEAKGIGSKGVDFCELCRQYKAIEPYLEILLEAIDWVPYGSTIRKVVKLLMKFANEACKGCA
jgi:hypothetical protein